MRLYSQNDRNKHSLFLHIHAYIFMRNIFCLCLQNREDATQFRISPYSSTDSDNIYYIKFKDSLMHVKLVQEEAFSEHSNIIFPKGTANENIYVGVLAELLIC